MTERVRTLWCRVGLDVRDRRLFISDAGLEGLGEMIAQAACDKLKMTPEKLHAKTCTIGDPGAGENRRKLLKVTLRVFIETCELVDDTSPV